MTIRRNNSDDDSVESVTPVAAHHFSSTFANPFVSPSSTTEPQPKVVQAASSGSSSTTSVDGRVFVGGDNTSTPDWLDIGSPRSGDFILDTGASVAIDRSSHVSESGATTFDDAASELGRILADLDNPPTHPSTPAATAATAAATLRGITLLERFKAKLLSLSPAAPAAPSAAASSPSLSSGVSVGPSSRGGGGGGVASAAVSDPPLEEGSREPLCVPINAKGTPFFPASDANDWFDLSDDPMVLLTESERVQLSARDKHDVKIIEKITAALDIKFGVTKSSLTYTAEEGDITRHQFCQEQYTNTLDGIDRLIYRMSQYSMRGLLVIHRSKIISDGGGTAEELLDFTREADLAEDWHNVPWVEIVQYQELLKRQSNKASKQADGYLYHMLRASCTNSLREVIEKDFNRLRESQRGGLTYFWLLVNNQLRSTPGVVASLKTFLILFSQKGPSMFENMLQGAKQLKTAVNLLAGGQDLPHNADRLVLIGGTKSKNQLMKDVCNKTLLETELHRLSTFGGITAESNSQKSLRTNALKSIDLLEQVYLDQTAGNLAFADFQKDKRISLAGVRPGGDHGADRKCFNCEKKGCSVKTCKEPPNPARIKKNFEEFKKQKRSGKNTATSPATTPNGSVPERASFIKDDDGFHMAWCGDCNAYTKTHSSKYHNVWKADPERFNLSKISPNHQLITKNPAHFAKVAADLAAKSTATSATDGSSGGNSVENQVLGKIFRQLETSVGSEAQVQLVNAAKAQCRASGLDFR